MMEIGLKWMRGWLLAGVACATTHVVADESSTGFTGNGFDYVMLAIRSQNLEAAIDPEVMTDLAKRQIKTSSPLTAGGWQQVLDTLKPHGFTIQSVTLSKTRRVGLVTTPASWGYMNAMSALQTNDLARAMQLLKSTESDPSPMGQHCAGLLKAVQEVSGRNQQLGRLEAQVRQSLKDFKQAASDLETAQMAAKGKDLNRGSGSTVVGFAENRYNKAVADAKRCWETVDAIYEKMKASNPVIGAQFDEAYNNGYTVEAQMLFESLYTSYVRFRAMLALLKEAELLKIEGDITKLPDPVVSLRQNLKEAADASRAELKTAVAALDGNQSDKAYLAFTRAYLMDASTPICRAGSGFALVKQYIDSHAAMLGPVTEAERQARHEKLEAHSRENEKLGLLQALVEIKTGKRQESALADRSKIGTVRGLAVSDGQGTLFPLSVRIENVPVRPPKKKEESDGGYWSSVLLKELEQKDYPVSFGDYGAKDPFMLMAAIEAYKWLRSVDGSFRDRVGFKVEFHDLLAGKGGDSAGVTIATSAYSSVRKLPVRADVAMTGSIRGDGAVKAVGAVPTKVAGAAHAKEIEVVIVPRENEGDLLTLSPDQLCRVIIIVADDIRTYLKFATVPDKTKPSQEQSEAWETLRKLRLAQANLFLGNQTAARSILSELSSAHPELYTARRLIEILQGQLLLDGRHDELAAWKKQLDQARTQGMLAARTLDFEIPVTADPSLRAAEESKAAASDKARGKSATRPTDPTESEPENEAGTILKTATVNWVVLPFPKNSNWGGFKGAPAVVENGMLVLNGQPVRTESVFKAPTVVTLEVELDAFKANDGCFYIVFEPSDTPEGMESADAFKVVLGYRQRNGKGGHVTVEPSGKSGKVLTQPFDFQEAVTYKLQITVGRNDLKLSMNGNVITVPDVTVPFPEYRIRVIGWQPGNRWRVVKCQVR
jgi:hypothetical protein